MVNLIRKLRRWLGPAVPDTSTRTLDTSSMADLVRLLGSERDASGGVETRHDGPGIDANRPRS